jgi:hypothetical protein
MAIIIDLFANDKEVIQMEYNNKNYTQLNLVSGKKSKKIGFVSLESFYERMEVFDDSKNLKQFELQGYLNIFNATEPHLSAYILFDGNGVDKIKLFDVNNEMVFMADITIEDVKAICSELKKIVDA